MYCPMVILGRGSDGIVDDADTAGAASVLLVSSTGAAGVVATNSNGNGSGAIFIFFLVKFFLIYSFILVVRDILGCVFKFAFTFLIGSSISFAPGAFPLLAAIVARFSGVPPTK